MSDVTDYINALSEPRRSQVRHLHDVITAAAPDLPVTLWKSIIGYGHYHYKYASGREGDTFMFGLSSRKQYISLYSLAACADGTYLAESFKSRLSGTTIGKSCINITKPELIDDTVITDLVKQTVQLMQKA